MRGDLKQTCEAKVNGEKRFETRREWICPWSVMYLVDLILFLLKCTDQIDAIAEKLVQGNVHK